MKADLQDRPVTTGSNISCNLNDARLGISKVAGEHYRMRGI